MKVVNLTDLPEQIWSIAPCPEELPDNRGKPRVVSMARNISRMHSPFRSHSTIDCSSLRVAVWMSYNAPARMEVSRDEENDSRDDKLLVLESF